MGKQSQFRCKRVQNIGSLGNRSCLKTPRRSHQTPQGGFVRTWGKMERTRKDRSSRHITEILGKETSMYIKPSRKTRRRSGQCTNCHCPGWRRHLWNKTVQSLSSRQGLWRSTTSLCMMEKTSGLFWTQERRKSQTHGCKNQRSFSRQDQECLHNWC